MRFIKYAAILFVGLFGLTLFPHVLGLVVSSSMMAQLSKFNPIWVTNLEIYGLISLFALVLFLLARAFKISKMYGLFFSCLLAVCIVLIFEV